MAELGSKALSHRTVNSSCLKIRLLSTIGSNIHLPALAARANDFETAAFRI
jgi:hypothetical protein